jgi:hypothetical protein
MFEGLDEIDWAAMRQAYRSAAGVPELLRGLASGDPAVREAALNGMYGAVYDQGDVDECTVASVPFLLEVAADPGLPDRAGVVRLLASISGFHGDERSDVGGVADPENADTVPAMLRQMARRAVAAACTQLLGLLADADPQVRRIVPTVLLTCDDDGDRVVRALQDRMRLETDPVVRSAIIDGVGRLGRRAAAGRVALTDVGAVGAWLAEQADSQAAPRLRLAAMSELAGCVPSALPAGIVATAAELLRAVYAAGTPPHPPARSRNALIDGMRKALEQQAAGRRAPDAARLVDDLCSALGGRVEDRVELLGTLLLEPGWEPRLDAISPAGQLIGEWRGSFADLVFLIGQQLLDPNARLRDCAARVLKSLDELAAPAADALARSLDDAPRSAPRPERLDRPGLPPWVETSERQPPTISPVVRALAALRDARALPAVRFALEYPDVPNNAGWFAAQFAADPQAADLVPLIRRRLRELAETGDEFWRIGSICNTLGRCGDTAAVPDLAALALRAEKAAIAALGQIGPAAAEAIPALRRVLGCGKPRAEIAAASALWHIDRDAGSILPVLARYLDGTEFDVEATEALAALGPAAAAVAPVLRDKLRGTDKNVWRQPYAARALWRATGDTDTTVPALCAVWAARRHTPSHVHLARTAAEMGRAAGALTPLLREELGERSRHGTRGGERSSASIADDLELQRACTDALAAIGG